MGNKWQSRKTRTKITQKKYISKINQSSIQMDAATNSVVYAAKI